MYIQCLGKPPYKHMCVLATNDLATSIIKSIGGEGEVDETLYQKNVALFVSLVRMLYHA